MSELTEVPRPGAPDDGGDDLPPLLRDTVVIDLRPYAGIPAAAAPVVGLTAPAPAPPAFTAPSPRHTGGPTAVPGLHHAATQARPAGSPVTATVTASTAPPVIRPQSDDDPDWDLVDAFQARAAAQMGEVAERRTLSDAERHELGRAIVQQLVDDHANAAIANGDRALSPAHQRAMVKAVMDAMFALGRIQPYVDDDDVENIEIIGCDHVVVAHANGEVVHRPPVARSDDELVAAISHMSAQRGRPWTESSYDLALTLPEYRVRVQATAWCTPRPIITIRRDRLSHATLPDLVNRAMIDDCLANFLQAAVRARLNIVIGGDQGSGKTTLLRTLACCIPPAERVGTVESERELHLDQLPHIFPRGVVVLEGRRGSNERDVLGRRVGEITLDDLLFMALRHNLDRILVGECRGPEIRALLKATLQGAGAMSTVHAKTGGAVVNRLVQLAIEDPHVTSELAYSIIAQNLDLVVYITKETRGNGIYRYVSEVRLIGEGERNNNGISSTPLFAPGPDGRAVFQGGLDIALQNRLEAHGLDPAWLQQTAGTWRPRPVGFQEQTWS